MTKEETLAKREAQAFAQRSKPEDCQQALLLLLREARADHTITSVSEANLDGKLYATGEVDGSGRLIPLTPDSKLAIGEVLSNGGETFYIASLKGKGK